jgi:hypothetical protein
VRAQSPWRASTARWYAEQGCPKINDDYSYGPQPVSKAREEAEVALSSESDSDSYYSDCFDSAKARYPTPPNAHMGTVATQSVHSIEACYKTPMGHFYVEHDVHRKVEVQHPRNLNPRRVGKKTRPRQTPTKAKRYTQPTQLRASDNMGFLRGRGCNRPEDHAVAMATCYADYQVVIESD